MTYIFNSHKVSGFSHNIIHYTDWGCKLYAIILQNNINQIIDTISKYMNIVELSMFRYQSIQKHRYYQSKYYRNVGTARLATINNKLRNKQ